jgi:hypothetical protein
MDSKNHVLRKEEQEELARQINVKNPWTSRFIKAAIIQTVLASVVTVFLILEQLGPLKLLSFLMSYNVSDTTYAGTWFNFGYLMYLVGVLAVGLMAMFYKHFESTLGKTYGKVTGILAALHLILMNIGLVITTWLMMVAGYIGGVSQMSADFGGKGMAAIQVHESIFQIMVPSGLTNWVAIGILMTALGVILGGIGFFVNLRQSRKEV